MREIKFRVWDKLLKEFNVLSLHDITEDDYWYDGKSEMWSVFYDGTHEQEKFIIEQYTGLKDIHGVEIYEGDEIEFNGTKGKVEWDNNTASFRFKSYTSIYSLAFSKYNIINIEVIGNIHQEEFKKNKK